MGLPSSNKGKRYIIQYSGPDIPGLLYTTADVLYGKAMVEAEYAEGFNIVDISMATGGGRHTTFITCIKEGANPSINSKRAREWIEKTVTAELKQLYMTYAEKNEEVGAYVPKVDVFIMEEDSWSLSIYLEMRIQKKPGFIAKLSDKLRGQYTLDDMFIRTDHTESTILTKLSPTAKNLAVIHDEAEKSAQPNHELIRTKLSNLSALISKLRDAKDKHWRDYKVNLTKAEVVYGSYPIYDFNLLPDEIAQPISEEVTNESQDR